MPRFVILISCVFALLARVAPAAEPAAAPAAEPAAADLEFFEQKIRPVLVAECYQCHSADAAKRNKLKGGLSLDTREATRRGGDSGPAVVPGKVEDSLIVTALRHEQFLMPPTKKLPPGVVTDFETWIKRGAADPRDGTATKTVTIDYQKARREHWSFQPLSDPGPPKVGNSAWIRNDVDRFILAKLEAANISPSPSADPAALIRRVSFDLIGLPPTPDEVASFVQACASSAPVDGATGPESPGEKAYLALVNKLLASPHYGERWGRHWLDLARYADSNGFHSDLDRPNAWRYRDYVISSFNADKPYPQFVAEQLAGDELDGANDETLIATGFNCNGPSNDDNMGSGRALQQYRLDQLDDVISTTSTVFLGLTLGCARCHDHKFDPISAEDYYRFLAIFNNTEKRGGVRTKAAAKEGEDKFPKIQSLVETSAKVRPTYLLRRGNLDFRGPEVPPGVPTITALQPVTFPDPAKEATSTGRRRVLAQWIAAPENPLTYRVLANRLWQHHFGRGIVATPSNFGQGGAKPTHPELLDFLARRIIADGGRMKAVHRLIVTSATYRQSSAIVNVPLPSGYAQPQVAAQTPHTLDPDALLLWRYPRKRLEAEALRDAVLTASGKLNPVMGGPGIKPRIRAELLNASQRNKWPLLVHEGPEHWRRSIYIYVKRQLLMPMMELFDAPSASETCANRAASVVPTQALLLMNDEFIEDQARFLAERVLAETQGDLPQSVARAFVVVLSRSPTAQRHREALDFIAARETAYLADKVKPDAARLRAVADLAHVLFNCNEFVYVE